MTYAIIWLIAAIASVLALNRYFDALRSRWAADAWIARHRTRLNHKSR